MRCFAFRTTTLRTARPPSTPSAPLGSGDGTLAAPCSHLSRSLEDTALDEAIRTRRKGSASPFVTSNALLRRMAMNALRRQLRDTSPEVRFWYAFGLSLLSACEARHDLRRLQHDRAIVASWWTVGEEASDGSTSSKAAIHRIDSPCVPLNPDEDATL